MMEWFLVKIGLGWRKNLYKKTKQISSLEKKICLLHAGVNNFLINHNEVLKKGSMV